MKTLRSALLKLATVVLLAGLLCPTLLIAQIKVTRVAGPDQLAGKNGVVYALPRTRIVVDINIAKSQQFAGPLAGYAADYLGIDDVITRDAVSYSIEKAAILTFSEPDPDQVYLVEREDKSQNEVWLSFAKEPHLLVLESFQKEMVPEGFSNWNKELYITAESGQIFKKYSDSPTREITDTIIRKLSVDTLVYQEYIFRHYREKYSDQEKAQDAADKIRQIEHDKYNLLIGYPETAYSKDALEFMVNELEKQRLEYLKLFTGATVNESIRFSFTVLPEPGLEKQEYSVAGFSKLSGITEPAEDNQIQLILNPGQEMGKKANTPEGQVTGLVYLLPATVQAVLSYQDKELSSRRIEVLQLGSVMTLPPSFKRIEFDLERGSVRSVVME